jgi:hypothetical protein
MQMKRFLRSCLLLVATSGSLQAQAEVDARFAAKAEDFLVQDVCLDSAGNVLPGVSPISEGHQCARHRKLTAGEPLPYMRHDWANDHDLVTQPAGLERTDSYPVKAGNRTLYVSEFDFGTPPRAFGRFDSGEGGQVVALNGDRASAVLTQDSKGLKFFFGPACQPSIGWHALDDSWVLFDSTVFGAGAGTTVARLHQSLDPNTCPAHLDNAFTRWAMKDIRFRRNAAHDVTEPLRTIVTDHFSNETEDASGSMERMYFTRELGWTRWERWQNLAVAKGDAADYRRRAERVAESHRCDLRDSAPSSHGEWLMVDCREWTNIQPPQEGAGAPESFWIGSLLHGKSAVPMARVPER